MKLILKIIMLAIIGFGIFVEPAISQTASQQSPPSKPKEKEPFPFIFTGLVDSSADRKFRIEKRSGRPFFFVKIGEEIPDSGGWKISKYEGKFKDVPLPGINSDGTTTSKKVDVSELTLTNKESGESIVLVMERLPLFR